MQAFLESLVFAAIVLAPIFASLGPRRLVAKDLPMNIEAPRHQAAGEFSVLRPPPAE